MQSYFKWVIQEYVYVLTYCLSILLFILGFIAMNIMVLTFASLMLFSIIHKTYKEWKKLVKEYEKIHNQQKPS